jgi:hypothetical protein
VFYTSALTLVQDDTAAISVVVLSIIATLTILQRRLVGFGAARLRN